MARLAFVALLAAAALLVLACGGGGDGEQAPTATAAPGLRLLFYSDRDGDDDVYTAALDGGDLRQLTDDPGRDYEADASPDGGTLVFASERSGELGAQLYLMDADGSNVRRLTHSAVEGVRVIDDYAHWDHEGGKIVFQRTTIASEPGPDADVWLIDPETGEETQLTDTPTAWDSTPAFSPDGRAVLFESDRDGDYDPYRLDLETMEVTRLTDDPARELQVKESPSDGGLLFISNRDGDFEIFVMNADGSDVRQLTDDPGKDTDPHWAHLE